MGKSVLKAWMLSWAMVHETKGLVLLPNERIIYTSPLRTSIALKSIHPGPDKQSFARQASTGHVHLTNQRIVYLPSQPTQEFQSFSAPLLNLIDTHVAAPFFGPNVWNAVVQPVSGGGIPASFAAIQLKLTFKDGGAFDFHSNYEQIKERLQQAVERARESGLISGDGAQVGGSGRDGGAFGVVDFANVHLEDLPAYESNSTTGNNHDISGTLPPQTTTTTTTTTTTATATSAANEDSRSGRPSFETPTDPPPGYEEVQQQSVANELENQLRRRRQ
ncbi:TPA_exp: Uncharacterized protein A8136_3826 [Trichophyton benhamiae CBS 112371]|uniref:Uncharacterized protein n=1 Tax=Arthroderma benhamiae (strain ATCC MYA-4681 / CBS 112371) TaxID=663331 RepID=D4B1K6_ARTBC|nr:uncharacterized protein ARB_02335 [Trichophyton benhamiae CBS 112371]EFE30845.1 hypothetical protein ARB_02335 [Trichophyton benhamiae CBS 112371]DAA74044.1 TPA_exp: Uncharacterized protein A8136_3826 [Trichophyton benhamiae CBS 112371]